MKTEVDVKLIARAAEGDSASQRAIYEAFHDRAFRLAYLLLGDVQDVEEVVQDAFVYALHNLDRYDPDQASLWTWVRLILVSRCRNKRRRKRLPHVSLDVLGASGREPGDIAPFGDPAEATVRREAQRRVYEALEQVSAGARDALILRYYEELSYAEIGEILGCTNAAARQRVVHGKRQLREHLGRDVAASAAEWRGARTAEVG